MTFQIPQVSSVLGDGALLLLSMKGSEALGTPFSYVVDLLSDRDDLDFGTLLGGPMGITVELEDQSSKEFNGIVTEFGIVGGLGRYARYRAVLRPWLWLMSKRTNCRIFQHKNVRDVVCELFREHGFADFEDRLTEADRYKPLEYLVQYRESDLSFVSRIMEHEGIYYYFRHEKGRHVLVLADSYSAHEAASGAEEIAYFSPTQGQNHELDHLDRWTCSRQICSGAFVGRDYDFMKPRAAITPSAKHLHSHTYADFERFEYPADFIEAEEGSRRTRLRLEEHQADHEMADAEGNVRAVSAGHLFKLQGFSREEQNKEHLIVASSHDLEVTGYAEESGGDRTTVYRMRISAMDSSRPYRPSRKTEKPVVEGPQTAIVTGEAGQDIWTDKFGRVKVQFHWDRVGKNDEDSSCWVRVSQLWAGSGFGGIHIPRIGQEVIVDFLEGDPDRPIITGRVYNEDNKPPYELPQNQTQSGIKSRSTLNGTPNNFNEIRFEDKKGGEELYVQAEKIQTTLVKGDQTITVKGNRTRSVGGDESISVQGTRTTTVTKKDTVNLKDAHDITVHLKVKQTYEDSHDITVTNLHKGMYDGKRDVTVKTEDKLEVNGGNKITTVHGEYNVTADTHFKVEQGTNSLLIENKIEGTTTGGPIALCNGSAIINLTGGTIELIANDAISLTCGAASLTFKSDGTIELKGGQKVNVGSGNSTVALEPTGVNVSGTKIGSHAIGMHEISGALVKIN